ncbi:unnamed protein product [Effrenium voratum]|nr:unnamed protein product [Effrenium voratum]
MEKEADTMADFQQEVDNAWARNDDMMYHMLHLALRLHSTKTRPKDLTAGDMQVWLGLAGACIAAVRCHRQRCVAFQAAVAQLGDTYGAGLKEASVPVSRDLLLSTFAQLDRLLEGIAQARLINPSESALQSAALALFAVVSSVRSSEEFRCMQAEADSVRVKATFLEKLVTEVGLRSLSSRFLRDFLPAFPSSRAMVGGQWLWMIRDQRPRREPDLAPGGPKRRSCDAVSGRSVACCLVSFCSTLYLAGIQTEVRVLNGMQPPNAEVHADRTISAPSLSPPQAAISVTETSTSPTPTPTSSEAANGSSPEIGYMIPRADCPKGADQVASLEECIAAAAFLKKKMMSTTPFSAHSDPVGCIYRTTDRDIFFNNHPEGSPNKERRPICKGPLLAVGAGGLNPKSIKPVAAWDQASEEMRHAAAKIRLFCFAWTPFRGGDQAMLAEVTLQYNKCDGHAFFSDRYPGGEKREDVVVVKVPEQRVPRTDQQWLYHRNMVGLMPTWDHLLRTGLAEQYETGSSTPS